ncbi:MAG: hypothetical protein WAU28_00530 [Candidatus Moraniibacteriota bacterium]
MKLGLIGIFTLIAVSVIGASSMDSSTKTLILCILLAGVAGASRPIIRDIVARYPTAIPPDEG